MPAPTPNESAREQLAALAAGSVEPAGGRLAERFGSIGPGSRAAAVLVLFGVLDRLPSDHLSRTEAVSRDLDVLLLARARTLRSHAGQVAFPGGRLDPSDEGPVAAALREAEEETGLDIAGVEVLGALDDIPLAFSRHVVTPVLAWWRHPSSVRVVDAGESSAVFRAPVADLLDPAHRVTTVVHRDGARWTGPGFIVTRDDGERLVWGFTAMVLDALFDMLGWTEPWDAGRQLVLTP